MPRKRSRQRNSRKPFSEHLKDLFSLHTGERRGFLGVTLVLLLAIGWVVYEQWFHHAPIPDLAEAEIELKEWLESSQPQIANGTPVVKKAVGPFDPNDLDRQDWIELGLTERQAEGIMRYVEKGGRFRSKKDVKKMYTIPPELYAGLEPHILLPDSIVRPVLERKIFNEKTGRPRNESSPPERSHSVKEKIAPLEVNTADSTELVILPGVGPAFARGIVKYRNALGGYHSLDQLAEVYVLRDKPEAVQRLKEVLLIDPSRIQRIDINKATAEELKTHPYLNWKIANGLVNFRDQHGPFRSVEDVKRSVLMNDSLYRKIAPYLKVE